MNATSTSSFDPAALAAEVRDLATEAYRTLSDPLDDIPHARQLTERISHLRNHVRGLDAEELALWLENLQRRLSPATSDRDSGRPPRG